MKTNAQQWAADWAAGMNNSQEKVKRGVNAVKEAPGVTAAKSIEKMRANWIAALDSGRWQMNTTAVTLQAWQSAMINKGLPRIADGVRAAQQKVQNYATRAMPVYETLQNQIRQMPKRTVQDSLARVRVWMEGMQAAREQLRGAV